MAGRKDKYTVDYFPHYVTHGKTLFIIESKFGNDGYAAWFKILETLGSSEHHFIDCRKDEDWEYLNAKIKLMHTSLQDVLDLCAKLGAIDKQLWENRIIFSENFVKNITDAYTRRSTDCPTLEDVVNIIGINADINGINDGKKTQRKEKDIKVNIEARKKSFYNEVAEYKEKYSSEMLRAFYEYWTELNRAGVKMKFEMQKTWETGKRLATWAKNENGFAPKKKTVNPLEFTM